jgi:putative DNA primase/helicase
MLLHDRAADNWRPLLAIADAAGGAWPERARKAALTLAAADDQSKIKFANHEATEGLALR